MKATAKSKSGPEKLNAIEVVFHSASRLLDELLTAEQAVRYIVAARELPGELVKKVLPKFARKRAAELHPYPAEHELNEALNYLQTFARHDEWFDVAAGKCLSSRMPMQERAARIVLQLKRIGAQTVAIYRAGADGSDAFHRFHMGLMRLDREKNSTEQLRFADACWGRTTRILSELALYLTATNLPDRQAELDAIRLQLNGPFIPTPKQSMLHAVLKKRGRLTKEQLAGALEDELNASKRDGEKHETVDGNDLYDRWGLSELQLLGFINNMHPGYVVIAELPSLSLHKSARTRRAGATSPAS